MLRRGHGSGRSSGGLSKPTGRHVERERRGGVTLGDLLRQVNIELREANVPLAWVRGVCCRDRGLAPKHVIHIPVRRTISRVIGKC